MRVLIDEDVPHAIVRVLEGDNHEVRLVTAVLGPGTPDPAVATYANLHGLVVVTFNLRDYNMLIRRAPLQGHDGLPNAGLLGFQCPHPQGATRLAAFLPNIVHEHDALQAIQAGDRRLMVQITETVLKILR